MVAPQDDVVLFLVDLDSDESRGLAGSLEALRDRRADDLAAVGDPGRLEDAELAVLLRQLGCALVGEDREHARSRQRVRRVDGADRALRRAGNNELA